MLASLPRRDAAAPGRYLADYIGPMPRLPRRAAAVPRAGRAVQLPRQPRRAAAVSASPGCCHFGCANLLIRTASRRTGHAHCTIVYR